MANPQPYIRCSHVVKKFGEICVIDGLSLDIFKGEFISLLGPSGSGKTTLLTIIAGFEAPTEGAILIDGYRIDETPAHKRNMGVVFQNYALFPHMTVVQNVGFPLKMRGVPRRQIAERAAKALEMVELGALAGRYPGQLSGGQQQRVALARALVFEPRVVLMDEPLGALDKRLREQMQLDIRDLHRKLGLTIIFVTHDQSEALTMSDRIAVFNKGRIEQLASPEDMYDRPATRFVAEFLGETNLLQGRATGARTLALAGGASVSVAQDLAPGETADVSLRPERIRLSDEPAGPNAFPATIRDRVYLGNHLRLALDTPLGPMIVQADRRSGHPDIGETLTMSFAPEDCWVIGP